MSIHQVVDISSSQYVQSESGTSVMKLRIIDEEGHRVILTMFGLHGVGDFMTISEQD
jgi:hypothetical protein